MKLSLILIGLVLILASGFGGIYLGKYLYAPTPSAGGSETTKATPTNTPFATSTPDPTADWKTYISSDKKYSFRYPSSPGWKVGEGKTPAGFWTSAFCQGCTAWNVDNFTVSMLIYKSLSEYSRNSVGLGITDVTSTKIGNLDAIESLSVGSAQAPTCMQFFTVYKGQGYEIAQCFSENVVGMNKLTDLPKPFPDILSTFRFRE